MSGDISALRNMLANGVQELGLDLSDAQIDKMIAYLTLLSKWNSVYNLTAIRDLRNGETHYWTPLSAAPAFKDAKNILDVGAGGGLPGMMLAIAYPDTRISMIDTVSKKTAF
jgi:16S rRNA (guanine527-N7)-methyltransferase